MDNGFLISLLKTADTNKSHQEDSTGGGSCESPTEITRITHYLTVTEI